jgi:benzoate/toluate 1,2-dioxygenase alpha subunit
MATSLVEQPSLASWQRADIAVSRAPERDLQTYIVDQPETGAFTVDRALFADLALFELEMKYIFEGTWVYVAHESQLPRPHDFYTVTIGRQPVVLMRNQAGELGGFLNACPHRGATVCVQKRGNQKILTCPYHGWSFNSSGKLVSIKDAATGAYPESFERADHNLLRLPRLASYRGFLFASLNPDVPDLETHLGETRRFIDMLVDQAPQGLEVVRGSSDYTYAGNWKLQVENGVDGYHFDIVHRTFLGVVQRRARSGEDSVKAVDITRLDTMRNGLYDLGNGHTLLWTDYPNPQDRPGYERRAEFSARHGELYARWMTERLRNLLIYPNVFLMDQTSTQIRVIHPLTVNKTKVSTYCIAPVGESAEARAHRLRQYEDFFNASGVGTPDDLAAFEACQRGYQGALARWQQGYERGVKRMARGADEEARALGVQPYSTTNDFRDETIYHGQYRQWLTLMLAGQQRERRERHGA